MTLAGRAVLVRFVLTAIPIYLLVAIKVSKWFLRSMDKIRRGFLFFFLEYAGELHIIALIGEFWPNSLTPHSLTQHTHTLTWTLTHAPKNNETKQAHNQQLVGEPSSDHGTKTFSTCKHPKFSFLPCKEESSINSRSSPIEHHIIPSLSNTPCSKHNQGVEPLL